MREGVVVAEFEDLWEARIAREALADARIQAWLEGSDERRLHGVAGHRIRLVVAEEDAVDALEVLVDSADEDDELQPGRRPVWVVVVAAVVAVGMVVAAVPRFLWPWIVFFGFVGFLLWRALSPRRPRTPFG